MPNTLEQTPRAADERDAQGRLTRAGMESVLRRGESVLLDDRVINRLEDLPDEADLAAGDEAALDRSHDALAAEQAALDRRFARLSAARAAAQAKTQAKPPAAETKPPTEGEPKPPETAAAPEGEREPKPEGGDESSTEGGPAFARPFGGRKGGR